MEAGYAWERNDTTTENAVTRALSLAVVARPEVGATPEPDVVGGIARFGLSSSKQRIDIDSAGGIVRFDFGS